MAGYWGGRSRAISGGGAPRPGAPAGTWAGSSGRQQQLDATSFINNPSNRGGHAMLRIDRSYLAVMQSPNRLERLHRLRVPSSVHRPQVSEVQHQPEGRKPLQPSLPLIG